MPHSLTLDLESLVALYTSIQMANVHETPLSYFKEFRFLALGGDVGLNAKVVSIVIRHDMSYRY